MFASLRISTIACLGVCAGLVGLPSIASAGLPGDATIEFKRLLVHLDGESTPTEPSTVEQQRHYFNAAHCLCSMSHPASPEATFSWELQLQNRTQAITQPADFWVGTQCDQLQSRTTSCTQLSSNIAQIDLLQNVTAFPFSTYAVMQPKGGDCSPMETEVAVWIAANTSGDAEYDYWTSKTVTADTKPPPVPLAVAADSGESAIRISWSAPTVTTDIDKFQFFCAAADGKVALAKTPPEPLYDTAGALCGDASGGASISFTAADGSGAPVPDWLVGADPAYLCGEVASSATSIRIDGFTNGRPYQVAMVAVDRAGNAAGVFIPQAVTPVAVTDFWEDLHNQGSEVEGGFCLIARTYGDDSDLSQRLRQFRDDTLSRTAMGRWLTARYYAVSAKLAPHIDGGLARLLAAGLLAPLVVAALLWHVLTLPGCAAALAAWLLWRRRARRGGARRAPSARGRATAAALTALALSGWARPSAAQSVNPYWDDDRVTSSDFAQDDTVRWHAGIRVGPYTPAIDEQFGMDPGPYEQMFGGSVGILPMLDVDWIVWRGFGQLGIGGSAGYLSKTARTYVDGTSGADRPRAADKNRFRMVPLAATAVYRLTLLDDRYHVPVIPYFRGGLAYYLWWVEGPDGGVASVCRTGGSTCDENKARGGSLGLVGALGLAVRAERIDPEAASAMREGGIQHAGFYAELQAAKVDDFGIGNKLAVGDLTWFAGVDFEF